MEMQIPGLGNEPVYNNAREQLPQAPKPYEKVDPRDNAKHSQDRKNILDKRRKEK